MGYCVEDLNIQSNDDATKNDHLLYLPDSCYREDILPDQIVRDESEYKTADPHTGVRYSSPQSCLAGAVHVVVEDKAEVLSNINVEGNKVVF